MIWALLALLGAWLVYRVRANRRIERPPVLDAEGRPYEPIEIALSDGARVDVIDAGAGKVVLLVPGADGVRQTWRHQLPALTQRYRAIAPDLRSVLPADATFDRFSDDLREILDARGVERAVVVGQSLGGAIAMRFAVAEAGRVRGLAIVNSLARVSYGHVGLNRTLLVPVAMATTRYLPTFLARGFARLWSRLRVWVFDARPDDDRVIDYVLWTGPRTVSPGVSGARVDLLRREDLRPDLPRITVPSIVVKGPCDSYVPVAWSREIADLIPGARYVEVPDTGHVSHIARPEAFNRILLDWLDEITGAGSPEDGEPIPASTEAEA